MTDTHTLETRDLRLAYDGDPVVHDLTLAVPPGRVSVIVGANGCGKSTLLRGIGRLLRPQAGSVLLDGDDIARLAPRAVARVLGLLPQQPLAPEGISVSDLVGRGRHPHQGVFRRWSPEDDRIVARALSVTGTADLAGRRVEELSGGQRQRVWIAMALAQQPEILLLDEPTTFLDVAHQIDLLDLLGGLNAERGTTIVMVLHDLNLAVRYADHLVVMGGGRVLKSGDPRTVLTEELVREAFGLEARIIPDPVTGDPMVVPVSGHVRARRGGSPDIG
ncbi:MAG TPA: ABC transporter ATP-binding protein [Nocardioides sp.]|nr:ABC transporter ATP-binding protein [Nocardioides sp.]